MPSSPTNPYDSVTVVGAGSMGTAMAILLARAGREVTLRARTAGQAARLAAAGENERHLPGRPLPGPVRVVGGDAPADAADVYVVAVPSKFLRGELRRLAPSVDPGVPVVSVVKGIENGTFARPSVMVREEWGNRPVVCLSGPSHAEEIASCLPTSCVAASDDPAEGSANAAARTQVTFGTDRFRVYTNDDLVGVELAGGLKNVFGIAAGICCGIGYGDNALAALLTRAIVEMGRFGDAFGADPHTFAGLAGVGDLVTTCTSEHGRNRAVGVRLGRGEKLDDVLASTDSVAEGVPTTRSVWEMTRERGIQMPIVEEVYRVLFEGKSPAEATESLMMRPLGPERVRLD